MVSRGLTSPRMRADLTEQAAAGLVEKHGVGALTILRERAQTAEELGHRVAAATWHQMADAAARLLRIDRSDADPAWPGAWFGTYHVSGRSRRGTAEHRGKPASK
jgi:hypothetical protein